MIKGFADRRLDHNAWEIALVDHDRKTMFKFEFTEHEFEPGLRGQTTMVPFTRVEILRAMAEALQEMGIMPESATTAELKATKFHLEDFRKLVFKA